MSEILLIKPWFLLINFFATNKKVLMGIILPLAGGRVIKVYSISLIN